MKSKLEWKVANRDRSLYRAMWFVCLCDVFQNGNGSWGYMISGTGTIYAEFTYGSRDEAMKECENEVYKACAEFMSVEWHPVTS